MRKHAPLMLAALVAGAFGSNLTLAADSSNPHNSAVPSSQSQRTNPGQTQQPNDPNVTMQQQTNPRDTSKQGGNTSTPGGNTSMTPGGSTSTEGTTKAPSGGQATGQSPSSAGRTTGEGQTGQNPPSGTTQGDRPSNNDDTRMENREQMQPSQEPRSEAGDDQFTRDDRRERNDREERDARRDDNRDRTPVERYGRETNNDGASTDRTRKGNGGRGN